jgi:hypothetical protein
MKEENDSSNSGQRGEGEREGEKRGEKKRERKRSIQTRSGRDSNACSIFSFSGDAGRGPTMRLRDDPRRYEIERRQKGSEREEVEKISKGKKEKPLSLSLCLSLCHCLIFVSKELTRVSM